MKKTKVLILCVNNSARSQMAEGILRNLSQGRMEVHSAGARATEVNPFAIRAMKEINIDISGQRSKSAAEFANQLFDTVIAVCDNASESCPAFPGAPERIHLSIEDPAAVKGNEEQKLRAFREARDELIRRLQEFASK